ncbi:DMT family transporter [Halobacillus salinus]|uniref:EamA/RhaT family transporter n=1 Tax=Halobacillus salinus TaxID=192814 RepID=A0A4Z0H0F8_9BACI|nr:DMT family transporter [Halobacillus salinus]TGB03600.1 EamA/RhaT family transporter [Halobacillus salinus]
MNRFVFGILVVITTALMGSSFAVGKIAIAYISPLLLSAFRFILAGSIMVISVLYLRRPQPEGRKDWLLIGLIGLFQTAGVMGFIFISLRSIPASESSILTFTNPLIVIVLSTIFLKKRYNTRHWFGVSLGFLGVFITLGGQLNLETGTILSLLAAVSWAIATILINVYGKRFDVWVLSGYQMLFGGLFLLASSFLFEQQEMVINAASVSLTLWLAIMASVVQFTIWFFLLQKGDPGKTSAFLFLAPFFGVLFGWLLLGEELKIGTLGGGLLILVGIFLVNWTRKSPVPQVEDKAFEYGHQKIK